MTSVESDLAQRKYTLGKMDEKSQKNLSIGLLCSAVITYIIAVIFNALNGSGAFVPEIFTSTIGNMSDKYDTYITPAGFTFSIWSVIYIWISVSLVLLVVTIFIKNKDGILFLNPPFATPLLTGLMTVNFILNLAWVFIWDREYLIFAAIILFSLAISGIAIVGIMARNIDMYSVYSKGNHMYTWGIVYRVIMNGFGMYTTWCVIASLVNLTTALVYVGGTDMTKTCLAALSLLVIFHSTWFIIENFVFDRYVRYLLTPYLVVLWAVNGIRAKIMDRDEIPQEIKSYVIAILVIAALTIVIRLGLVVFRYFRKPLTRVMDME